MSMKMMWLICCGFQSHQILSPVYINQAIAHIAKALIDFLVFIHYTLFLVAPFKNPFPRTIDHVLLKTVWSHLMPFFGHLFTCKSNVEINLLLFASFMVWHIRKWEWRVHFCYRSSFFFLWFLNFVINNLFLIIFCPSFPVLHQPEYIYC